MCIQAKKRERKKKPPPTMFIKLPRIAPSLIKLKPGNCPSEEKVGNAQCFWLGQGQGSCPARPTVTQRSPSASRGRVARGGRARTRPGARSSTCLVPQDNARAALVSPPHSLPSSAPWSFNPPRLGPLLSSSLGTQGKATWELQHAGEGRDSRACAGAAAGIGTDKHHLTRFSLRVLSNSRCTRSSPGHCLLRPQGGTLSYGMTQMSCPCSSRPRKRCPEGI